MGPLSSAAGRIRYIENKSMTSSGLQTESSITPQPSTLPPVPDDYLRSFLIPKLGSIKFPYYYFR
jgi:hypothetical protein